jgi:hypothetical protein
MSGSGELDPHLKALLEARKQREQSQKELTLKQARQESARQEAEQEVIAGLREVAQALRGKISQLRKALPELKCIMEEGEKLIRLQYEHLVINIGVKSFRSAQGEEYGLQLGGNGALVELVPFRGNQKLEWRNREVDARETLRSDTPGGLVGDSQKVASLILKCAESPSMHKDLFTMTDASWRRYSAARCPNNKWQDHPASENDDEGASRPGGVCGSPATLCGQFSTPILASARSGAGLLLSPNF